MAKSTSRDSGATIPNRAYEGPKENIAEANKYCEGDVPGVDVEGDKKKHRYGEEE